MEGGGQAISENSVREGKNSGTPKMRDMVFETSLMRILLCLIQLSICSIFTGFLWRYVPCCIQQQRTMKGKCLDGLSVTAIMLWPQHTVPPSDHEIPPLLYQMATISQALLAYINSFYWLVPKFTRYHYTDFFFGKIQKNKYSSITLPFVQTLHTQVSPTLRIIGSNANTARLF